MLVAHEHAACVRSHLPAGATATLQGTPSRKAERTRPSRGEGWTGWRERTPVAPELPMETLRAYCAPSSYGRATGHSDCVALEHEPIPELTPELLSRGSKLCAAPQTHIVNGHLLLTAPSVRALGVLVPGVAEEHLRCLRMRALWRARPALTRVSPGGGDAFDAHARSNDDDPETASLAAKNRRARFDLTLVQTLNEAKCIGAGTV